MRHSYINTADGSVIHLVICDSHFERITEKDVSDKLYTFAWNQGPIQKITLDDVVYDFPANAVLPIMMSQRFRCECPQQISALQFNREFYCIVNHDAEVGCVGFLFYGISATMFIQPDEETSLEIEVLLRGITRELSTDEVSKSEMLRTLLVRFIILLTRQAKRQYLDKKNAGERFNLLRHYNLLVEQHFRAEHRVQFYADKLFKSPKTISNIFSQYSSKTPQAIIHERIIAEAKRLLYYSEKSMKEIALFLGFDDPAHFSKFFKNQTGENPTEVKKKWRHGKEIQDNGNNVNG